MGCASSRLHEALIDANTVIITNDRRRAVPTTPSKRDRTCFNGINALSGIGLLSIPYALSQGGWLSLAIFLAIAIICFYTGVLLHRRQPAR
ncbi:hypothetical protein PR202_ga00544 [Eleusine coracana subsp. coracana]|uniref:Amino acid transporter transmembrane domain-containing protein n=1 Tax=Eleusine coracana subsp. coracana TaxID=191504 RepID=A0AAV5BGS6_ELECO|nr:hypothetical protein PR202_ga00544 [Eleusine coracana subsp. coracana]